MNRNSPCVTLDTATEFLLDDKSESLATVNMIAEAGDSESTSRLPLALQWHSHESHDVTQPRCTAACGRNHGRRQLARDSARTRRTWPQQAARQPPAAALPLPGGLCRGRREGPAQGPGLGPGSRANMKPPARPPRPTAAAARGRLRGPVTATVPVTRSDVVPLGLRVLVLRLG